VTPRRRLLALALTAGLAAAVFLPIDAPSSVPPICLFRITTGFDCPGCGMTRAFVHLGHGDAAGAFDLHPLVVVAAPAVAALWIALLVEAATRRPVIERVGARTRNLVAIGLTVVFVAVWLARTAAALAGGARPWEQSLAWKVFG